MSKPEVKVKRTSDVISVFFEMTWISMIPLKKAILYLLTAYEIKSDVRTTIYIIIITVVPNIRVFTMRGHQVRTKLVL